MRVAAVTKMVSVALLVVAALSTSAALAGTPKDPACVQACADQYFLDKQACLDTYNQALADAQAQEDACLLLPANQQPACLRGVDSLRRQAKHDYQVCLRAAKKAYNACVSACPPASPTAP